MKLFDPPRLRGKYLSRVLASKWLTTGPMNERLRGALSKFLNVGPERIVLASSATAGFQAVCDLVYKPIFHELFITDKTWPGMRNAAYLAGFSLANSEIAGVIVQTDIGGRAFIERITDSLCAEVFIHDACHSWLPDTYCDFAVMSFYPTKLVPGAEGGVIVCKDPERAKELPQWLNCGLHPVYGTGINRDLRAKVCGRKANMTDVAAALNLEALELAPCYMEQIAEAHAKLATEAEKRAVPFRAQPIRPYLFQIECSPERVQDIRQLLDKKSIPTAWNFPPAGLVTLPCYPRMTKNDARFVIGTTARILEKMNK